MPTYKLTNFPFRGRAEVSGSVWFIHCAVLIGHKMELYELSQTLRLPAKYCTWPESHLRMSEFRLLSGTETQTGSVSALEFS